MKIKEIVRRVFFLIAFMYGTCLSYSQATAIYDTINPNGGKKDENEDIRVIYNRGGNFQVRYNGKNQIFDPIFNRPRDGNFPGTNNGVPGTWHGIILKIGGSQYTFGTMRHYSSIQAADFIVSHSKTVVNNVTTVNMTYHITNGGKLYVFNLTYEYTHPSNRLKATYEVVLPPSPKRVILSHGWDTYLGGLDRGPGFYSTSPQEVSVVRACDAYQGIRYISGVNWNGYYTGDYNSMPTDLGNNNTYSNVVDSDPNTDNGIGFSVDFGNTQGTFSSTNYLIFAPNVPQLRSNSLVTECPNNSVSESQADSLVVNLPSDEVDWFTVTSTDTTPVVFPIVSLGDTVISAYPSTQVNGCNIISPVPLTLFLTLCCKADGSRPSFPSENYYTNCGEPSVFDLSTVVDTSGPTGTVLRWFTAPDTDSVLTSITAVEAGVYYAAFYDTAQDCYGSCGFTAVNVLESACGTIDCDKVMLAETSSDSGQYTLVLEINVLKIGCYTPLSVTGSGFSAPENTSVCANSLGIRRFNVPLNHDGLTSFSSISVSLGTLATCSLSLDNTTQKNVSMKVWTTDNCSVKVAPPKLK